MSIYSLERKESALKKLNSPLKPSYRKVSEEEGIPITTLYTWCKSQTRVNEMASKVVKETKTWGAEARFSIIVETAALSESELGEYCRKKGIYPEQIKMWKADFIKNGALQLVSKQQEKKQSSIDKKRIQQLEKELQRKEKALAEAAALLILRKKLQAFYGEGNEDD